MYKEITGDIIAFADEGNCDVVIQGNNCFCTQGAGLAPQFVRAFSSDKFPMEHPSTAGDINKLGQIDYASFYVKKGAGKLVYTTDKTDSSRLKNGYKRVRAVNCYTQYGFGANHKNGTKAPIDYEALTLCLRKINHTFKGMHIAVPQIGCGLAGGDWNIVKKIIQQELKDCDVTVVIYVHEPIHSSLNALNYIM